MTTGAPATRQPGPGMDGQPAGGFVLRLLLGAQLRRFREAADITPNRAGYEIRASRSKISRMESGHAALRRPIGGPAVLRAQLRHACRHDWLYRADCQRNMKGTKE